MRKDLITSAEAFEVETITRKRGVSIAVGAIAKAEQWTDAFRCRGRGAVGRG